MELELKTLLGLLSGLWWPFCRAMALLSFAPMVGEAMVPITIRLLISMVLAVVLMPVSQHTAAQVDLLSLQAIVVTVEQVLLGLVIGLAFHLALSAVTMLGFLLSSQLGLAMAQMNDPINGSASDVISGLLTMLCMMVFFSVDGHLLFVRVLGGSFQAWPVGGGLANLSLESVPLNAAWVFAAALLLALPVIFSTLVVQVGMGLLNRVAPTLNLFSMGFALVTLFGLFMLTRILAFVPQQYLAMTEKVLQLIEHGLRTGAMHGQ